MAVRRLIAPLAATAVLVAGCGGSHPGVTVRTLPIPSRSARTAARTARIPRRLLREARPIGHGAAFHPPARGPVLGRCRRAIGRRVGVHLELFAANRVVLVASAIGTRGPYRHSGGRIVSARCYGSLVTLDPTGVLRIRRGARLTVADVFRSWGRRLGRRRMLSFRGRVRAYVDGRRWTRTVPSAIPLRRHAEIVLEVGPRVPPHRVYHFPPGT
jgi:hypothetical protein